MPRHPDRQIERLAQPDGRPAARRERRGRRRHRQRRAARRPPAAGHRCVRRPVHRRAGRGPAGHRGRLARPGGRRATTTCPGRARCRCRPATLAAVLVDVCGGLAAGGRAPDPGGELARGQLGHAAAGRRRGPAAARGAGGDRRDARDHAHAVSRTRWSSPTPGRWRRRRCSPTTRPWCTWTGPRRPSERAAGEAAHGLFRRPDVYPVLRDFHQIAADRLVRAARAGRGRPGRGDRRGGRRPRGAPAPGRSGPRCPA